MKLIVDGREMAFTESAEDSLRDVVERISMDLLKQNRVISELQVDGVEMGNWDAPEFIRLTVGATAELSIRSDEPRKQAIKILYEIASYMPQLEKHLISVSEQIQSRKEEEGMEHLANVMQNWAELQGGLESAVTFIGVDLSLVAVQDKTYADLREEILDQLDAVRELFEGRRLLEISDILEYELAPRIGRMEEGIYQVIKFAEKKLH